MKKRTTTARKMGMLRKSVNCSKLAKVEGVIYQEPSMMTRELLPPVRQVLVAEQSVVELAALVSARATNNLV